MNNELNYAKALAETVTCEITKQLHRADKLREENIKNWLAYKHIDEMNACLDVLYIVKNCLKSFDKRNVYYSDANGLYLAAAEKGNEKIQLIISAENADKAYELLIKNTKEGHERKKFIANHRGWHFHVDYLGFTLTKTGINMRL